MRPSSMDPDAPAQYALAMHDFEPSSATCLSFRAGQVIRTLNKDDSGWWDGELEGKRGWFPSNYVEVCDTEQGWTPTETGEWSSRRSADAARLEARPKTQLPDEQLNTSQGSFAASTSKRPSSVGVLESIQHAISLLQNAVAANRIAHFQPATACVISSVRTVLSTTACLTRESPLLLRHPALAASRKKILSSLAALVNQARRASAPAIPEDVRDGEKSTMVNMAHNVWAGVESFLEVAGRYGVKVFEITPPTLSKSDSSQAIEHAETSAPPPQSDPTPTTVSSSASVATLLSPTSTRACVTVRTTQELSEILTFIDDQLLSTIAAFIGHIHAHTRTAHSSSYAHLIDMTRETIAKVRELLVVVEAVMNCSALVAEAATLASHRDTLHVATTALVSAARIATSDLDGDASKVEDEERSKLLISATAVLRAGGNCISGIQTCIAARDANAGPFELVLSNVNQPTALATTEYEKYGPMASSSASTARTPTRDVKDVGARFDHADEEEEERAGDQVTQLREGQHSPELSYSRYSAEMDARYEDRKSMSTPSSAGVQHRKSLSITSSGATVTTQRNGSINGLPISHSRTSSRASSRAENRVVSVPMARNESSRTSDSATSSRSALSNSTSATSPRSSMSVNASAHSPASSKYSERPTVSSRSVSQRSSPPLARRSGSYRVTHATPFPSSSSASTSSVNAWYLERDYEAREIAFNGDGHVTGGTLECLVERMSLHDTTIDPTFSNAFFLTFRMFTTPLELSTELYRRYSITPPSDLSADEVKEWTKSKATPVRLRVYNLLKTWVESHWHHETDRVIIDSLLEFSREKLAVTMASAGQRLVDLVQKRVMCAAALPPLRRGIVRMKSSDRMRAGKIVDQADPYSPATPTHGPLPPASIAPKSLLSHIRSSSNLLTSINIVDIDPLELARQITIMESRIYCLIKPEELLCQELGKKGAATINVRAMSTLSTRLTGWVAETILNEQDAKKRTGLVKYFIKLCDRCHSLNNYNALMAVLCALSSSTIARLKKTWEGISPKHLANLDSLRKSVEHSRNYYEYRARLRTVVDEPCLPFLGLYLTDVTFCYEGNAAERVSPLDPTLKLINFDRYSKMAKIINDLQRFQHPYNLVEVPELQHFLTVTLSSISADGDVGSLYRRSLFVEPREGSELISGRAGDSFGWK